MPLTTDPKELAILAGAGDGRYRQTRITFDTADVALQEPFNLVHREARQMRPLQVLDCTLLKCGVYILTPLQGLSWAHESQAAQAYTVRLADLSAADVLVEVPHFRNPTELPGLTTGSDVPTTGDYFLTKRITAGETWSNVIAGPGVLPDELAGDLTHPLENVAKTIETVDGMVGWLLKIAVPGGALATPDFAVACVFGGELYGSGHAHSGFGKFCLGIAGDGQMSLYEWIDEEWQEAGRWRGFDGPKTLQEGLIVRIVPAWPRFLEISPSPAREPLPRLIDQLAQIAEVAALAARGDFANNTFVYETTNRGEQAVANGPGWLAPIVGRGPFSLWVRQDLRPLIQINKLGFPDEGLIEDRGFALRGAVGTEHIVRVNIKGYNHIPEAESPANTEMAADLTAADGSPLVEAEETFTYAGEQRTFSGWQVAGPGGENALRATFTLRTLEAEGQRVHTPYFTGYSAVRNAHLDTVSPGEKVVNHFHVTGASIAGDAYEPDQATATFEIRDLTNSLSFLRARGRATVRVETTFDSGLTDRCVLFEGYVGRVTSTLEGKLGQVYPSPSWHDMRVECLGKWDKLSDRFFTDVIPFTDDSDSPSGSTENRKRPWKIVDIVRFCLNINGVPDDQILTPDSDIRIFAPVGQEAAGTMIVMPGMSVTEYLSSIVRDYLGGWIIFDANAGASGAFRVLLPPVGTETPVWNFVNTAPTGGPKLAHLDAAYGVRTSRIETFLRSYVVRSEGNILHVVGGADPQTGEVVRRTLVNPFSFDGPTHSIADDTDLDWWGEAREVLYIDPTIRDQATCDFVARRVYSIALRGRRFLEFEASAVLLDVEDPSSPAYEEGVYTQRRRRLIRPGDLVTVDGTTCVVHQCSPSWENDAFCRAFYEVELFRGNVTFL